MSNLGIDGDFSIYILAPPGMVAVVQIIHFCDICCSKYCPEGVA